MPDTRLPDVDPALLAPLPAWRVDASRTLLSDRWLTLRADTCTLPDGGPTLAPYYVVQERDWVHALAFDAHGRVMLVAQHRHAAGATVVELPGGIVDDGESPGDAAARELREETGHDATEWHAAGWLWANPARQTNRVHLFIARGLHAAGPATPDHGEQLACGSATPAGIAQLIATGAFSQALHVASFHQGLAAARALGWVAPGAALAADAGTALSHNPCQP